ncbi:MAG: hypothetical protein JRI36_09170 [Deltaproteobacteria bacterium]|nr:hypothetical protein [Deltaproteobacteria bacterium]
MFDISPPPHPLMALRRRLGIGLLVAVLLLPGTAWAKRTHEVFFKGTDYELHVYRRYGREPGRTLLLIGGIQGNEPGGFLSADLYADMALAKGNLIVVPRANFYSIVLNKRQVNEDMNRKFGPDTRTDYEAKIVSILKQLISESDCLLNLHDGSGFYSPRWEGPMKNPMRFGQSIIADCETYTVPGTGHTLNLGDMARRVVKKVNTRIKEKDYQFKFNNHHTRESNTRHPEQRKSATYYALFTCGIPAFGIETSKSLPLEMKVRHHILAINAFMELLDIIPESPGVYLDPPVMQYVVMAVNDNIPFAIPNGHSLRIREGDVAKIFHVEANYKRGISADIVGFGTMNDMGKPIRITHPTQVIVRKDHHPCGMINIVLDRGPARTPTVSALPEVLFFETRINGEKQLFTNNASARLVRGDRFELVDVITNLANPSEVVANFKGYVGNRKVNTGEDRGYVIHTGRDLWKRYSLDGKGKKYQIVVTHGEAVLGRLFVELVEPKLDYVILQVNGGSKHCLYPGDSLPIDRNDTINIVDIKTNVLANAGVCAFLKGRRTRIPMFREAQTVTPSLALQDMQYAGNYTIEVERERSVFGSVLLDLQQKGGGPHGSDQG